MRGARLILLAVTAYFGILFLEHAVTGRAKPVPVSQAEMPLSGLPKLKIPKHNPLSPAKVELGKTLFFDPRLSRDGTVSCSSCHDPTKGWTDGLPTSIGIDRGRGTKNAPSIVNAAYMKRLFWDGRAKSLEDQVHFPVEDSIEMDSSLPAVVRILRGVPGYAPLFKAAFGTRGINASRVVQSIASFERTILSENAPFDRYLRGEKGALSRAEKRGKLTFFGVNGCSSCHKGQLYTEQTFQDFDIEEADGKFRVPTLRHLRYTAPFMHDGSIATLEDVVDFYNTGARGNRPKLGLGRRGKADLTAFLKALSGENPVVRPPKLP